MGSSYVLPVLIKGRSDISQRTKVKVQSIAEFSSKKGEGGSNHLLGAICIENKHLLKKRGSGPPGPPPPSGSAPARLASQVLAP